MKKQFILLFIAFFIGICLPCKKYNGLQACDKTTAVCLISRTTVANRIVAEKISPSDFEEDFTPYNRCALPLIH